MSKRIKDLITAELETKFTGADSVVVIDYAGIPSKDTNAIRGDLRKKNVKMTVVRNAMAAKALGNVGLKGADHLLIGTNAICYGGDSVVDIVKELVEQVKKQEKLKIKGAIVEGQVLDSKAAEALAKYPSKKELQGMIAGQIKSPASKIAGQIKGPGAKIAGIIKAVIEKKEKEGGDAPAPEPTPAAA
jgi:large subunit ribosomal protein L10